MKLAYSGRSLENLCMISSFLHRSFVSHTRFLFSCCDSFKVPSRTPGRLRATASTPVQGTCDAGDAPPRVPQGRLGGEREGPSRQTIVLEVTELLRQMMQILSILAGEVELFQINEYKHYALHATECSRESYAQVFRMQDCDQMHSSPTRWHGLGEAAVGIESRDPPQQPGSHPQTKYGTAMQRIHRILQTKRASTSSDVWHT